MNARPAKLHSARLRYAKTDQEEAPPKWVLKHFKDNGHTRRPLPGSNPKTLELRTGCCWPVNDGGPFLFCDDTRDGTSRYCPAHRKIGTRPKHDAWEDRT